MKMPIETSAGIGNRTSSRSQHHISIPLATDSCRGIYICVPHELVPDPYLIKTGTAQLLMPVSYVSHID